jgi:arginase
MTAVTRGFAAALIGAPTDVGAGERGASMGPEALRVAGIEHALREQGADVEDRGDVTGPANPGRPAIAGHRHLKEVVAWVEGVRAATARSLADGRIPILMGGDHSLSIGSIGAVADHCRRDGRRLVVLWLDAHPDFNTSRLSPSGNLHGMPMACLCGLGPPEFAGGEGRRPMLEPAQVSQVGIRSVDRGERFLLQEHGMAVFDMRAIDEIGMRAVMDRALADVDGDTHLHVSLDVDFLDSELAPGVATAIPGGPSYREAQLCMEMVADTGRLGSLDIVELNPAFDHRNRTGRLAVDLVGSLFGKSTLLPAARQRGAGRAAGS